MEITKNPKNKLKKVCEQYKNKSLKNTKTDLSTLSYILITIGLALFVIIIYILYKKYNYLIYKAYYRGRTFMYPNNKSFDYTNNKWIKYNAKHDCSNYVPYKVK
jgi:hypothetical protein